MYNYITSEKIKSIPPIGDIDIDRLPQELTKIYAQIIGLRRQVIDGTINFQDDAFMSGLTLLQKLANNLETLLLVCPAQEYKESISFVAATANNLFHKMKLVNTTNEALLGEDFISSYIAAIVLFLIGNSQADAAEAAHYIANMDCDNEIQQELVNTITFLATGKLLLVLDNTFDEKNIIKENNYQQIALNYLWRELGLGIKDIAKGLLGESIKNKQDHFENVIKLSVYESQMFNQQEVYYGPLRLAKLLTILEKDIFNRAAINISPPKDVNPVLWRSFLIELSKERPFLWENHREALDTHFLDNGISAVLTLPTGAGKSTLSELKIASCLYCEKKVVYIVPTHALEDQVNKSLRHLFSDFKSINIEFDSEYSEIEEIAQFPILVMTPERCLTYLNINPNYFKNVGLIVFDEFHLIHTSDLKKDRRSIDAMYCLLSLFVVAPEADYLLISAMVENGKDIASWISEITGRECLIFNSTWKPTRQLHGCLIFEEEEIDELSKKIYREKSIGKTKSPSSALKKSVNIAPHCFFSLKNIWETTDDNDYFKMQILDRKVTLGINKWWQLTSNRNKIAADLAIHFSGLGLKTLVFVDDPRIANSTSKIIAEAVNNLSNKYTEYFNANKYYIECIEAELGSIEHSYFYNCQNVGVHHGLLLPIERSLIENYFKDVNGASVLVATATLAQGINLPAEIVIIAGDDRFDEDGGSRERVRPYELLNAAGRAGRAGLSSQGAVLLIPGDIVLIKGSTISDRWWKLKDEVFSKGDQCLVIEDPLEYFLDSLQGSMETLSVEQINTLYRFRSEKLSGDETKKMLNKSFYAYKARKGDFIGHFDTQVRKLLDIRNELDDLSEECLWQKEIGIKVGIEPQIICKLSDKLDEEGLENMMSKTILELIDWYFHWLSSDEKYVEKIFVKQSTLNQIKKAIGVSFEIQLVDVLANINILADILKSYVRGMPLNELNEIIPDVNRVDTTIYLIKARNFVNRLIPELSFSFGVLSLTIIEKAKQQKKIKDHIPLTIKVLASCIREGVDSSEKLYFKKSNNLLMRVETHLKFDKIKRKGLR